MANTRTPAHEFLDTHVLPNHDAWIEHPTDMRLAMNAVLSLYHMADHFWHVFRKTDPNRTFHTPTAGAFRGELAKRDHKFAVLRDVAEAHKHMRLDRPERRITYAKQTSTSPTGFGEAGFGTGPYGGGPSIVVTLDDDSKHHLSHLTQHLRRSWVSMLA